MSTISQGITVPAGLADGSTASASQIIPLYNVLNAFVIPDTVGVFQQAFVSDSLYTVATGTSQDWSVSVTNNKALILAVSFSWAGAAAAPTIIFRVNGSAVTAAASLTNAATGNGLLRVWIGGHDTTDVPRPLWMTIIDGSTITNTMANADLPNATTTSVGVTVGGAGNTFKFKYVRAWREG